MAKVSDEIVESFAKLFRGRTDVWGSVEGRSNKETVTLENYRKHLEGKVSMGAYMLQDDGTCWFFALDLDEKDIDKICAIRDTFKEMGITAYPSYSKGKGFHCYIFADQEPFIAADARRLCHAVLAKLKIQTEVFPKQDMLDSKIPYGNYINLPAFGMNSRQFFTEQKTLLRIEDLLKDVVRNTRQQITDALGKLPEPIKPTIVKASKGRPKKSKNPLCIDSLLKGVGSGQRDVAAFALARYFHEQRYIEEEIFQALQQWDTLNKPPLNDANLLLTKVQSAVKGYGFGCSSIKDDPLLAGHCVGPENCKWLAEQTAERKKKGLIREETFLETDTHLYEEIYRDGKVQFAAYEISTGKIEFLDEIEFTNFTIIPVSGQEIVEGVIKLPSGVEDYGNTVSLKNEIKELIYTYVDIQKTDNLEYSAWYVILSWIYDRLNTLSYLRFLGDTGTGKSRALDVIGKVCYKPLMMAGAVTPAPIYREIRRFRGTLILEEADFSDSTEKGEVTTILNCGIERGRAVLRCSSDDPNVIEVLPCFGPKLFATRRSFTDKALESRCITTQMEETDRIDIPPILGRTYEERSLNLRNKLLLWRFHHRQKINADIVENIDLGNIEPRLKQMGLPFAIPFHDLPDVMDDFRNFMKERQIDLIAERVESEEGRVVNSIFQLARDNGVDWLTSSQIAEKMTNDIFKYTPQKIGGFLKSLNITTRKMRRITDKKQERYLVWENRIMRKLARRYIPDYEEEYGDLLEEELDMEI